MRRKNREISIFSMSALDLFASALGAFILIALIALPDYLKTVPVKVEIQQLKQQIQHQQAQLQQAQQKHDALQQERDALEQERDALQQALQDAQGSIRFTLLGIATQAKSFVTLVDMSGSMDQYDATLKRVFRELTTELDGSIQMQIIGFQGDDSSLHLPTWQTPRQLKALTPAGKQQAIAYVDSLAGRFAGGTPTGAALKEALKYPAQAILLLSDGAPNGNAQAIISEITRLNQGQKQIHAIAIGDYFSDAALVNFLKGLAQRNNGGFVGVAN